MLKTETNTQRVAADVIRAARASFGRGHYQVDFEHGQWWLTNVKSGAQYSVCDAEGENCHYGFCFEQVTQGYDD